MSNGINTVLISSTVTASRDGSWHYYSMTVDRDSDTGMKVYIDGINVANHNPTAVGDIALSSISTKIGWQPNEPFNGLIDDVRIYNYARTPSQILQDYNAGLGVHFK